MSDRKTISPDAGWIKGATALFLVGCVGTALFLLGPTLDMSFGSLGKPVGPGTVPLMVLTLTILMALIVAAQELLHLFKTRKGISEPTKMPSDKDSTANEASALRRVVYAAATLALLVAFISFWRYIGFPVAASAFVVIMSLCLSPTSWRSLRCSLVTVTVAITTAIAIWLLFEFVLNIRLH